MKVNKTTLPNGLRLLTIPMPSLESATVTVWIKVGSRYEEASVSGISHFLEHMVFKGGQKYKTAQEVSEAVDAMGAQNNAATSKDWTHFYIKSRVANLEKSFDILSDMLISPRFDEEDISRERGVILSEMDMYEDAPMYRVGDIFEQVIYQNSPLGVDIIGSKKTVSALTREDFLAFQKAHYHPENIIITVAGGVTDIEVQKLTEKYFGGLESANLSKKDGQLVPNVGNKLRVINKKSEQVHFIVGYRALSYVDKRKHTLEILSTILGGGMSSRLFSEVREKRGLAYTVRTSSDYYIDTGSISTYAGVDPKSTFAALEVILSEHQRITKPNTITDEELKKAKEYLKGHLALSLENTKSVNNYFGYEELMLGQTTTPDEEYEAIDSVTKEDVQTLAKEIFVKGGAYLAVIGAFDDRKKFEEVLQSY